MSRSTQPLSEIHSGTHLVIVLEASFLRDHKNLPVIANDGSYGVKIRFNDNKLNMDWTYWTKFSDFKKLCKATLCDATKPVCPELRGKRLWLCVKEVKTMKDDTCLSTDYVPFDYIQCDNPQTKPIISGDPCQHPKGLPLGVFLEYSQRNVVAEHALAQHPLTEKDMIQPNVSLVAEMVPIQEELDAVGLALAQKLELGRKIIAEGEKKELTSLNQKNTPKEEEVDIFAEAEGPEESKDNNQVEDDWNDL